MAKRLFLSVLSVFFLLLFQGQAEGSRLENQLEQRLSGAWSILLTEGYSDCTGYYNNNEINLSGVTSKASRRFAAGEMVKIDKINLKRSRLDLFLTLAEPVLTSHIEGPFELFSESECKIQLLIALPRELIKAGESGPILDRVAKILEIHPSAAAAENSKAFNARERADYPDDYESTLAQYEIWKLEQLNIAVADRIAVSNRDARAIAIDIRRNADYLDGFAAGVEEMRTWRESDCSRLLSTSFQNKRDNPPSGKLSSSWKDGYSDGQELIFNLLIAERLQGCFVPVPR